MSLFKIYGSSAGSGKTFTLTKEYLKMVLSEEDPKYFQKILAITFTNDASNEMKQRIMKSLKEVSSENGSVMFDVIKTELKDISPEILKDRAGKIFLEILHNYNDFAVKTIDSFVNQIVSSFTFDLNLPYNYEINLDQSQILSEAVDILIDKVGNDDNLSNILLDFALNKIEEDKSWNTLSDEIKTFGKNIFENEGSYLISRNNELQVGDIQSIRKKINAFKKSINDEIKSKNRMALDLIKSKGLTAGDFKYKNKGVFGFFERLNDDPEDLFTKEKYPNTYHRNAFENDDWYSPQSETGPIIDGIKNDLRDIGIEVLALKSDKYLILNEISKNLLKIPLLTLIKEEVDKIKEDRNEVFLSEFNKKILDIIVQEPVPFIYERIGEKYDHLLIDEFQDTSNMQFFNLLPLIDNAISKNKFNLIVGDPKQAIYRWRGGNIQLMIDLMNKDADNLKLNKETSENQYQQIENVAFSGKIENLIVNYRSKPEVINFNNSFFESVVGEKTGEFPLIKNVFEDYFQNTPSASKEGGFVQLEALEKDADILEKLLFEINDIISDGFEPGDIAILCRTNSQSVVIADFLKKNGFDINSVDSLKIGKNLEVNLLTSFLQFIFQPESVFKKFELLQYFFQIKDISDLPDDYLEICKKTPPEFLQIFEKYGIKLEYLKIFEFDFYTASEYFIEKFGLLENKSSIPYILTFLDVLLQFYHKKSKSISDFLEHWELKRNAYSINNKSENAITVTTIHKSKGLEYPIVILPYVNWSPSPNAKDEVWIDVSDLGYEELENDERALIAAPFKPSLKSEIAFTKDILEMHEQLIYIENLNMLYVALTRPVERLYIWCHQTITKKETKFDGIGSLFMTFLQNTNLWNNQALVFPFGTKTKKIQKSTIEVLERPIPFHFNKVFEKPNTLRLKTDSNYRSLNQTEKVSLGNLVHAAFELIKTSEDVDLALEKIKTEGLISEMEFADLRERILKVINNEEIGFLFQKNAKIKNEVEILVKGQDIKRPDRIVFAKDQVYIVDYKTGEKKLQHQKQIKQYGGLLKEMGYSKINLLIIYLDPFEIVNV